MRVLLFLVSLLLVSCGGKGEPSPKPSPGNTITEEQVLELIEIRSLARQWAPTCTDRDGRDYYACSQNGDDGDSVLFMGLLCLSGETDQCFAVEDSQDLNTGRMARSPGLLYTRNVNEYSRDMFLGELAYLIKTKDTRLAQSHLSYIENNNYRLCDNPTDNRCNLSPLQHRAVWGLMKRVWEHMDLEPTFDMEQGDIGDDTLVKLQSEFTPGGFTLHLIAVEIMLRQRLNTNTKKIQEAADIIRERQDTNPFFEYVSRGKTKRAAQLVIEQCPRVRPSILNQWAWQRDVREQAWRQSKGWDCIFMVNILLGDGQ